MKNTSSLAAVVGGLAFITQLAWAQVEPPAPATPADPALPALPRLPAPPPGSEARVLDLTITDPGEPDDREDVVIEQREIRKAQKSMDRVGEDIRRSVNEAMAKTKTEIARARAEVARADKLRTIHRSNGRTLVLAAPNTSTGALTEAHEDLTVMARIFGKAASKSGKNQREFAFRFGEGRDLDGMYLNGLGALFFVSVDWPVSQPPKAEPKKTAKEDDTDAVWEKERRRLRNGAKEEEFDVDIELKETDEEESRFDETRVRELKERLVAAFRHAANLRGLKESEEIILVVLGHGHPRGGTAKVRTELFGGGPGSALILSAFGVGEAGGTTLTLRARKSDILKLVKNKASDEDFAKAIQIDDRAGLLSVGASVREF
jgi:hypothetical protein